MVQFTGSNVLTNSSLVVDDARHSRSSTCKNEGTTRKLNLPRMKRNMKPDRKFCDNEISVLPIFLLFFSYRSDQDILEPTQSMENSDHYFHHKRIYISLSDPDQFHRSIQIFEPVTLKHFHRTPGSRCPQGETTPITIANSSTTT